MRFRFIFTVLIAVIASSPAFANPTTVGKELEARAAFKKGYELFQAGEYYEAINNFKIAIVDTSYPLLDYSYYYIARAYQEKQNYEHALGVHNTVVKYFPESILAPKSLFAIGECQRSLKNYEEAAKTYRNFIARFPSNEEVPQARFRLGNALEELEEYIEAARTYRNLDLIHPQSYFAEKAIERLDRLAKISPLAAYEAPAATIYNLGVKHFESRNFSKAKEYFSRLTGFYKKSSFYDEALLMLGRLCLRKGKTNSAISYFKKVIGLDKDSKAEAMYYLARSYGYLDSPKTAIRTLEKVAALYPNSHSADEALYYIGYFQNELGNTEEAARAYSRLVSSYPNSSFFDEAFWRGGNMLYVKGDYQAAYAHFRQALSLPPEKSSDRLLFWAGKSAERLGKRDEALAAYKAVAEQYEHSYYGYRAREALEKESVPTRPLAITPISQIIEKIGGNSPDTLTHEEKYDELLEVGLADEAAEEALLLVEKVPLSEKDKARIAQYHAYLIKGKFAKPIQFADNKLHEAMLSGALSQVDSRLWKLSYPRGYWQYVEKYAKEYGLDPFLVYAVIREESRFLSRALSRSSAHGLMQIIPSTAKKICKALGLRYSRREIYEPALNIQMGSWYLSSLIERFGGNVALALAGYNGGPVRVKKWTQKYAELDMDEFIENIPIQETRNYVKKVMKSYYGYKRTYGS